MTSGEPDPVMQQVGLGIALRQQGDVEAAHRLFAQLWGQIGGEAGDAFHRCAIAHSMADSCDDVLEELQWDLRALRAADALTDGRAAAAGVAVTVAAFYPSLHLNLADCFHRLGEPDSARHHLRRGRASLDALPDDGYAAMIRSGLARLATALDEPVDPADTGERR